MVQYLGTTNPFAMYTTNSAMPRIRREATALFKKGWSSRNIAAAFDSRRTLRVLHLHKAKARFRGQLL